MVKLLGVVDLFAGLVLFSIMGGVFHAGVFVVVAILLIIKGGVSFFDVGGITDLVVALLILLSFVFTLPYTLLLVVAVIITLKALVSLIS